MSDNNLPVENRELEAQDALVDAAPAEVATPAGEEEKKKKRRLVPLILLGVLAGALIAGGVMYMILGGGLKRDAYASSISLADGDYDAIQAELDARTEASKLWISVAETMYSQDGTTLYAKNSTGLTLSVLDNLEENARGIVYTIKNAETGETFYTTGLLEPGDSLVTVDLDTPLPSGTTKMTAEAQGYDLETQQPMGGVLIADFKVVVG